AAESAPWWIPLSRRYKCTLIPPLKASGPKHRRPHNRQTHSRLRSSTHLTLHIPIRYVSLRAGVEAVVWCCAARSNRLPRL
ncbi:hypothetical protein LTR28_013891, partial [Elasticomyces elasticus]